MRFSLHSLLVFATTVLAAVKFSGLSSGATLGTGSVTIEWTDDGSSPAISTLSTYVLKLYVGGNQPDQNAGAIATLQAQGTFADGDKVTVNIDPTLAGPTPNGFYLEMLAVAKEGGTVTFFSDRFGMPTMTGVTNPQYAAAAGKVSGTSGPATVNNVANAAAPAAAGAGGGAVAGAGGAFAVPYALQSGLTRYAPMQGVPPTKITQQNVTPLYATSAHTVATTWLPRPTILTTLTQSQTFSVSSIENTAAPQSQPSGDMAKFLARWKD